VLRFLRLFWFLLNHPQVSKNKKILFVALPVAYWLLPDFIPFIIDDLIVLLIGFWIFVKSAKGDVPKDKVDEVIDVRATVVDDD